MFKHRLSVFALALITSLSLSSAPTMANPGNGNGGGHGNSGGKQGNSEGNGPAHKGSKAKNGSDNLVSVNVTYDRVRPLAVNYGLTGYQSLPPGIAKNLARGKPLPPGIAKKAVPASLLGQLPSYPGYEWRIVGNDLVLIALSTAIVASVINGVFD
ncbi:anti-virulence regulator CigR family protein [Yersinia aleksiciae]|uniref:anti-virulence regulator CigR family protein n=1 Tax=Yersinia aleksiciae TaxID=263819 RepID=UPI001427A462|nr:anti-virulence regulator CigR family protein [Yersinia aleksiciae]MDA5499797.1 anti-virulence regulator CigR family protein [Yersinia aleksiciae]NIL00685.1 RcnB family protein [Yersinia aleksiciae]WQC69790.1 anti-virulence regulator CigR family protein [Yersinia aleksiciae]